VQRNHAKPVQILDLVHIRDKTTIRQVGDFKRREFLTLLGKLCEIVAIVDSDINFFVQQRIE
jgi:hypothetical protein